MINLTDNNAELLLRLIGKAAQTETLKKAVFSKSLEATVNKATRLHP